MHRPVWAEIDLKNIAHNYQQVRKLVGSKVRVMAIVKANAYGHGAVEVARTLDEAGADCFGVAIVNEAVQLRKAGIKKAILILGWTPADDYERALENDVTLTIFSREEAEELSRISTRLGKTAVIHLKIDTGMGRIGFQADERAKQDIGKIMLLPNLKVEGVFTHLAKADEADKSYTQKQLSLFKQFVAALEEDNRFKFQIKHAANSAAIIDHPEAYFDLVRPGVMLYGLRPSQEVHLEKVDLRPALSLRGRISLVKEVAPGMAISYGGTYITSEASVIASVPLGYGDGYSRCLSNKAHVICHGQRIPVVGRICMDQLMLNATALRAKIKQGDTVTIIGSDGEISITVDELAQMLGTINYEIVCMISSRVPRIYH